MAAVAASAILVALTGGGLWWAGSLPFLPDAPMVLGDDGGAGRHVHHLAANQDGQDGGLADREAAPEPDVSFEPGESPEPAELDAEETPIAKCATLPQFVPTVAESGADELTITVTAHATCPDGDFLSSPRTSVTVRADDGNIVASGVFDFSGSPFVVAPQNDGAIATARLVYKAGTFWRLPVDIDTQQLRVVVEEDAASAPSPGATAPAEGSAGTLAPEPAAVSVSTQDPAPDVDVEQIAADALRWRADQDLVPLLRDYDDTWMPQLSSKRPGLEAEGRTWDTQSTYAEHLALRARFPTALLLYSGDWSTYTYDDFWVTVAGVGFSSPERANEWCDAEGFAVDDCFAKLIVSSGDPEDTTVYRD